MEAPFIPLKVLVPGKPMGADISGLPEEADPLQRQVQTADAHEGAHQGEAVPLRGEWQTANTLVSRNLAPLNHHYNMTPARQLTRGGVILRSCVTRDSG